MTNANSKSGEADHFGDANNKIVAAGDCAAGGAEQGANKRKRGTKSGASSQNTEVTESSPKKDPKNE